MSPPRTQSPQLPLSQLRFLPLITGAAWLTTLLSLLIDWLAEGRPRYPGQSNPNVAFISDIGAYRLQPLFVSGGTLTSICLAATILAVHYQYHYGHQIYNPPHHPDGSPRRRHPRYKRIASILAIVFAGFALPCQIALTVFDNHAHPSVHRVLLFVALGGTGLGAVCTAVVFWSEMGGHSSDDSNEAREKEEMRNERIRRRCVVASNGFLLVEIGLGVAFTALLGRGFYRVGGVVEWCMAGVMTGWQWAFWGFLLEGEDGREGKRGGGEEGEGEEERRPLLR